MCLPGTMLAARGRDKQDVGCSLTQMSFREETNAAIRETRLPPPPSYILLKPLLRGNRKSRPSAAAGVPARAPPLCFSPDPSDDCPRGCSIPWHVGSHYSPCADVLTSVLARLANPWPPSRNHTFACCYPNHRIVKETNYIKIKLPE